MINTCLTWWWLSHIRLTPQTHYHQYNWEYTTRMLTEEWTFRVPAGFLGVSLIVCITFPGGEKGKEKDTKGGGKRDEIRRTKVCNKTRQGEVWVSLTFISLMLCMYKFCLRTTISLYREEISNISSGIEGTQGLCAHLSVESYWQHCIRVTVSADLRVFLQQGKPLL